MKKFLLGAAALLLTNAVQAEDITIRFKDATAKVDQQVKDSVTITTNGAHVNIVSKFQDHKLTIRLTGKSNDGQLFLQTAGKAKVKLDNLQLTSQEGAPLWLKNKKKVEVSVAKGTTNTLSIAACNDTANHKAATIWAKDKLLLSGKGTLNVIATGDGCRGIKSKDNITIEELTLNVTTSGNHLGEKPFSMGGGFGGMHPEGNDSTHRGGFRGGFTGGMPGFQLDSIPEEVKQHMEEMRQAFEERMKNGDFPMMGGFGGPMGGEFGAPPAGDGENGGMPFGKHKYVSSTKGIASKGIVTINSGHVTVKTSTAGAEGIEGKKGVILNGGTVDVLAVDDAINANAAIEFRGADVTARSTTNDAVDANIGNFFMDFFNGQNNDDKEPAIIITGGKVFAWSQIGMPEEGLDCDFSPIAVSGGTVFSVGAGMGDMPSVPTQKTAQQPTALLVGIDIAQDEPILLCDSKNTLLETIQVPFSLQRSSSLISSPKMQVGETYTVKSKTFEKTFTQSEQFTIVR